MKKAIAGAALAAVCVLGCGRAPLDGSAERVAALEERVAQLEQANAALQARLGSPQAAPVKVSVDTQAVIRAVAACVNGVVSNAVSSQLERKIGSQSDIDAVFQQALREGLQAQESQKNAERDAQRKQFQARMEEQRTQWDARRMQRLAEELSLSDEQKAEMTKIEAEMRDELRKKVEETGGRGGGMDMESIRAAAEELRVKNEEAVARVLTPEQLEKYKSRPRNLMGMMSAFLGGWQPGAGGGQQGESAPGAP